MHGTLRSVIFPLNAYRHETTDGVCTYRGGTLHLARRPLPSSTGLATFSHLSHLSSQSGMVLPPLLLAGHKAAVAFGRRCICKKLSSPDVPSRLHLAFSPFPLYLRLSPAAAAALWSSCRRKPQLCCPAHLAPGAFHLSRPRSFRCRAHCPDFLRLLSSTSGDWSGLLRIYVLGYSVANDQLGGRLVV